MKKYIVLFILAIILGNVINATPICDRTRILPPEALAEIRQARYNQDPVVINMWDNLMLLDNEDGIEPFQYNSIFPDVLPTYLRKRSIQGLILNDSLCHNTADLYLNDVLNRMRSCSVKHCLIRYRIWRQELMISIVLKLILCEKTS